MYLVLFQLILVFFAGPSDLPNAVDHAFEDEWKLVKEKGEIKVFVKRKAAEFGTVRIEAYVDANLQEFISYINDASSYPEWLYACKEGKEIAKVNNTFTYYTVTEMPFPFYDRILTAKSTQQVSQHVFVSNTVSVDPISKNNDLVPIPYFKSSWVVVQDSPKRIHINFQIEVDPGGNIPAWLSNMAIDVGPYNTMNKLKELLEQKGNT